MSKQKNTDELMQHKLEALDKIDKYIDDLIASPDSTTKGKADKLCYWLEDYIRFLKYEPEAINRIWFRYKRGQIIKVHLGYNIGGEEGGLHYAVIVNCKIANSNPVLTIIPLTSVKKDTDLDNLKNGSVYLGNEIFTNLIAQHSSIYNYLNEKNKELQKNLADCEKGVALDFDMLKKDIDNITNEIKRFEHLKKEINKMKIGSIALVNQITTISKIRIYDPKSKFDVLAKVRLSNEKMDILDNEIKKMYTKV